MKRKLKKHSEYSARFSVNKMHEMSVVMALIDEIQSQIKNYNVKKVISIVLEVGEVTFLAEEQMKFAYEILTEDDDILKNSSLIIEKIPAEIECTECGYRGDIKKERIPETHFFIPVISCPMCKGKTKIVKGRDCILKRIDGEVNEDVPSQR